MSISAGGLPGFGYTLATTADGRVLVVGSSTNGGHSPVGSFTPTTVLPGTSARVVSGLAAKAVDAGGLYALAVGTDGILHGWGVANGGNLGGNLINGHVDTPREVPGAGGAVTQALAADGHALALRQDGSVVYWPGTANFANQAITAGRVSGVSDVVRMAHGPSAVTDGSRTEPFLIMSDGSAATVSWTFSNGVTVTHTAVVRRITDLSNVADIACAASHCLALNKDGSVSAWGRNSEGQFGDGTTADGSTVVIPAGGSSVEVKPVTVPGLSGVVAIGAIANASIAIRSDGSIWTWGESGNGQSTPVRLLVPTRLPQPAGAVGLSCGPGAHCVLRLDSGAVWSWGRNDNGQLGDLGTTSRDAPVQATGIDLD